MRYFIIFYNFYFNKYSGNGNTSVVGNKYPNCLEIQTYLSKYLKDAHGLSFNIPVNSIVITNVIELSKNDFDEWYRK